MPNRNNEFRADVLRFLGRRPFYFNVTEPNGGFASNIGYFDFNEDLGLLSLETGSAHGGKGSVRAYYLPYGDNQTHSITLGSAADYMFTPVMTGCTFAIGSAWFAPKVSHLNYQHPINHKNAGTIDQQTINQHVQQAHGNSFTTVTKRDYISTTEEQAIDKGTDDRIKLIVVGVRGYLGWYFYRTRLRDRGMGQLEVDQAPSRIN